jgi:hypothetical protein
MPGFHAGRPPRNKGLRYPADPPKVEEIIAVMRATGDDAHGRRLRGLIVILWRAGLRIQEALPPRRGRPRPPARRGASPPRQGRPASRGRHGRLGLVRHAHAIELAREGVSLIVIQRQLGHSNLASHPCTCRASTAQRSSQPSTPAANQ